MTVSAEPPWFAQLWIGCVIWPPLAPLIESMSIHLTGLARNYAYQVLLLDEWRRANVELVFLNKSLGQSPEDDLLLQMQGIIAEYEPAKFMERSRRGKRHAAQGGSLNVMSCAPFGYRYVSVREGGGKARFEPNDVQARVVQRVFTWIGHDRCTFPRSHLIYTASVPILVAELKSSLCLL